MIIFITSECIILELKTMGQMGETKMIQDVYHYQRNEVRVLSVISVVLNIQAKR